MKLYLLSCGQLLADRSLIFPGNDRRLKVTLPIPALLIQDGQRNVLVDTGMPVIGAGDPEAYGREYDMDPNFMKPLMRPDERIDVQLGKLGLETTDLDQVVNTHFHFDHAGANQLFVGVTVSAQEAEFETAREPNVYPPFWDAPGLQFRPVKGDWEVLPGVTFLSTPGHTPGHQSLLVDARPRPWLFTIDAAYTEEHWRTDHLGVVQDVPQGRASLTRLRDLAKETNAVVIFGHDLAQWESLGMGDGEPRLLLER